MAREVGVHTALSLNWALSCQLSDSPFASVHAPICAMAAMAHPAKRARTASTIPQVLKAEALAITTFHLADPSCHTQLKELSSFKPEFCHQLFGEDEEIKGYKDPTIDIWLNPVSFSCYVDFRCRLSHSCQAVEQQQYLLNSSTFCCKQTSCECI